MQTKVIWVNRHGEHREHTLGQIVTRFYAADWFRRSIIECQGILSRDEAYNSKLALLEIKNAFDTNGKLANFIYKSKQIEPEVHYLKGFINNDTEEVQLQKIKQNPFDIRYIDNPSEAVQLEAVKQFGYAITHIKNPTELVQLAAVKNNPYSMQYIKNPTQKVIKFLIRNS